MRPRGLVNPPLITADQALDSAAGRITFWSFTETTGTATAELQLWDGSSEGGQLIADITLNPSESVRDLFTVHALPYYTGLFLEWINGSINGQVFAISEDDWSEGLPVVVIGEVDVNIAAPA